MTFFNTTHEKGQTLIDFQMKAKNQNEAVLWVFEQPTIETLTPESCLLYLQAKDPKKYGNVPCTSIRRVFSNLSEGNIIEQTGDMTKGSYGRNVHIWKLCK